jgi:hypothetical protein
LRDFRDSASATFNVHEVGSAFRADTIGLGGRVDADEDDVRLADTVVDVRGKNRFLPQAVRTTESKPGS